jgi:hypothetical protein
VTGSVTRSFRGIKSRMGWSVSLRGWIEQGMALHVPASAEYLKGAAEDNARDAL